MTDTILYDVDLASNIKDYLVHNDNVMYKTDTLKDFISKSKDDDFLFITKKIGSAVTILDAKKFDDNLIKKILF